MDPLGFAYEGFDTIARLRTMDNGSPIDLTGKISNGAGTEATFKGPIKLATILSNFAQSELLLALKGSWS
ncbi:MAG TPA: hypothetical protein VFH73_12565, partial [Polyangia bacterium]|nr:hypothetical protein [Polyangia bacterium]